MGNEVSTTKIVKTLKIGTGSYEINAIQLGGHPASYFATEEALRGAVTNLESLMASALEYKGSLLSSSAKTGYTPAATKGDVYVVSVAGTVNGISCEAGDLWLCNATSVEAGTSTNKNTVNASWDIVQSNIDMATLKAEFSKANHTHTVTTSGAVNSRSITPKGTVSQPTFSGTTEGHTHTVATHEDHTFTGTGVELVGKFTGTSLTSSGPFTPEGTISKIEHTPAGSVDVTVVDAGSEDVAEIYSAEGTTGSSGSHTHTGKVSISYTPAGSVAISKGTGTANYTPAGFINRTGAHTHDTDVSIDYTPAGSLNSMGDHTHSVSSSGKFTPSGSVGSHSHNITSGTAKAITSVGGSLTGTYDADSETLELTHTITTSTANFVNSVTTATSAVAPTFTGTEGTVSVSGTSTSAGGHTHTFTGTAANLSGTFTSESSGGHNHTFAGTGVQLIASFTGTPATLLDNDLEISSAGGHTHTFTGRGKMLNGSFTGTPFSVTPTFNGTAKSINVTGTPKGSVEISVGTGTANYTPSGIVTKADKTLTTSSTSITPKGTVSQPTFTGTPESHDHSFSGSSVTTNEPKNN